MERIQRSSPKRVEVGADDGQRVGVHGVDPPGADRPVGDQPDGLEDLQVLRTADLVIGRSWARSLTVAGRSASRSTIVRRVGSAIASSRTDALVMTNASVN